MEKERQRKRWERHGGGEGRNEQGGTDRERRKGTEGKDGK